MLANNDAYSYLRMCSQCKKHFPGRKREYSCHACQIKALEAEVNGNSSGRELLARLSEILLGYREGDEHDMTAKVHSLVRISQGYQRNKQVDLLALEIRKLNDILDGIEEGD